MHNTRQPLRPFISFTIASPKVKARKHFARTLQVHRKRTVYNRAANKRKEIGS